MFTCTEPQLSPACSSTSNHRQRRSAIKEIFHGIVPDYLITFNFILIQAKYLNALDYWTKTEAVWQRSLHTGRVSLMLADGGGLANFLHGGWGAVLLKSVISFVWMVFKCRCLRSRHPTKATMADLSASSVAADTWQLVVFSLMVKSGAEECWYLRGPCWSLPPHTR